VDNPEKTDVRKFAPKTHNKWERVSASRGERLSTGEIRTVLAFDVIEVNVFGEPPISHPQIIEFGNFSPSRGVRSGSGAHTVTVRVGPRFLYLLYWSGPPSGLLGELGKQSDLTIAKIGMSRDPEGRRSELNSAIPPASRIKWELSMRSGAYPSVDIVIDAEDDLKLLFKSKFRSLGGEFFLGARDGMKSEFESFVRTWRPAPTRL
jgi:hypothetical protein